ncbi:MAG: ABC transporter permease [Acidimicrobiales bacterium]
MRRLPGAGPPPELRYRPTLNLVAALRGIWAARRLVRTLAERELRARYKRAALGFAWAIVTPVALMVAFTLFLNRYARVPTEGIPYPLFAYVGLLPWTFFSSSLAGGGQSLLANSSLLNKVYCPREVFPLASVAVAGVDTATALIALVGLFVLYGVAPSPLVVWVPLLLAVQVAFTLGLTFIFSAAIIYVRDLRHAMSIILQFGLFTTPVAFGIDVVPESWRSLYSAVNPLAPVIDGYRRTVLLGQPPQWHLLAPGALTATLLLVGGYLVFKRLEGGLADVA